jgi:DNA (cytosine-5)-methyltransferase 1
MLTIGSLCSGIGGLELGLEWAGLGPVLWQCEIDPYCRAVIRRHWPDAELHEDVTRLDGAALTRVGIMCFGAPCQDLSGAGKGAGIDGSRSRLVFDCLRIVSQVRPEWVVVENVASGARRWVDRIVSELERLGYACIPVPLAAADCGAPHLRRRIFIIAHANSQRREGSGSGSCEGRQRSASGGWWSFEPNVGRVVHGLFGGMDGRKRRARIRSLGNAVVPQCAEVVGWIIRELAISPPLTSGSR